MAKKLGIKEAKQRAGRFCAGRERSPHELYNKLLSWGLNPQEAEKVVAELNQMSFVDEQRFANAYVHDKFEFNHWGKQKIKAHIYVHQLPEKVIDAALKVIDDQAYREKLKKLAKAKWDKLSAEEPFKRKQKTLAYLSSKGYESDLIWEVINWLSESR